MQYNMLLLLLLGSLTHCAKYYADNMLCSDIVACLVKTIPFLSKCSGLLRCTMTMHLGYPQAGVRRSPYCSQDNHDRDI